MHPHPRIITMLVTGSLFAFGAHAIITSTKTPAPSPIRTSPTPKQSPTPSVRPTPTQSLPSPSPLQTPSPVPSPTISLPQGATIPTLIYHSVRPFYPNMTDVVHEFTVPPDVFEKQLQYLKTNGYTAILPKDLVAYFSSGTPLPAKPVMITFDDGWENQYRYAFPLLQKYGFKATFYIYSHAIGVKHFLTWQQVLEMRTAGMAIEGHSASHPLLSKIHDLQTLTDEIATSKRTIEQQIQGIVDSFAYPFGDYNDQTVSFVKQSNYTSARTVHKGKYVTPDTLFTIPGLITTDNFSAFVAYLNN